MSVCRCLLFALEYRFNSFKLMSSNEIANTKCMVKVFLCILMIRLFHFLVLVNQDIGLTQRHTQTEAAMTAFSLLSCNTNEQNMKCGTKVSFWFVDDFLWCYHSSQTNETKAVSRRKKNCVAQEKYDVHASYAQPHGTTYNIHKSSHEKWSSNTAKRT